MGLNADAKDSDPATTASARIDDLSAPEDGVFPKTTSAQAAAEMPPSRSAAAIANADARAYDHRQLQGFIDQANWTRIEGWVWDIAQPKKRVRIELLEDGVKLATTVASDDRPGLVRAGIGDGRHAFRLRLRPGLLSKRRHILELRCADTGAAIPGSPVVLEPPPEASSTDGGEERLHWGLDATSDGDGLGAPEAQLPTPTAAGRQSSSDHDEIEELRGSGLFDEEYYLQANPDVRQSGMDAAEHFCMHGWRESRNPNRYFDLAWYAQQRPPAARDAWNPLLSYAHEGEALGLRPTLFFDPIWYRAYYGLPPDASPLAHFLKNVRSGPFSPVPEIPPASAGDFNSVSEADQVWLLRRLNLVDVEYYLVANPDVLAMNVDPVEHFYRFGQAEGRNPNHYFDTKWYIKNNDETAKAQPLLHYALVGEKEGRRPSQRFDPVWYKRNYNLRSADRVWPHRHDDGHALAHYLANRRSGRFSPIPEFDTEYYLSSYPDIASAEIDPFEHFDRFGWREGRNPSAAFDIEFYTRRYLAGHAGENPLLHYVAHRHEPGVYGRMPDEEITIPREITRFTKPGNAFEEFCPLQDSTLRQVKLLAYYLPQFHAVPENDDWWGKGFTEWTNIVRGVPRFKGHYQPRVPRDLGFYSLDDIEPLRKQVDMARAGGVSGFIFYYYRFNGKRLLHGPVERLLSDPSVEMPFCLMWANENWTRRWDGLDSDVLIAQDYAADDDEGMVADFARHFADSRYIRLHGRPLLMIYRPVLIPNAAVRIARWRTMFQQRFGEAPLLIMAQSFDETDPGPYGLDGAIEFPPHKLTNQLRPINPELALLDEDFKGRAYSYDDVVRASVEEPAQSFPLIKTAFPSWDNDARQQGGGTAITGSTPAKYEAWLAELVEMGLKRPFFGEAVVCVNAWNEWCEGAYLEPDVHFGAAYLNATARAVCGFSRTPSS